MGLEVESFGDEKSELLSLHSEQTPRVAEPQFTESSLRISRWLRGINANVEPNFALIRTTSSSHLQRLRELSL